MCAARVASIHKTSHPRRAVVHVARVVTVWWELWYRTFIRTRDVLCSGPWMALPSVALPTRREGKCFMADV